LTEEKGNILYNRNSYSYDVSHGALLAI